jgi:hypothetical protein
MQLAQEVKTFSSTCEHILSAIDMNEGFLHQLSRLGHGSMNHEVLTAPI